MQEEEEQQALAEGGRSRVKLPNIMSTPTSSSTVESPYRVKAPKFTYWPGKTPDTQGQVKPTRPAQAPTAAASAQQARNQSPLASRAACAGSRPVSAACGHFSARAPASSLPVALTTQRLRRCGARPGETWARPSQVSPGRAGLSSQAEPDLARLSQT